MQNFRSGRLKVLIATDVSARGIDVPNVDYVVNYDLPETTEHYIHRVGRTGRGTQKGQAVSFCSTEEKELLETIESELGKPIGKLQMTKKDYELVLEAQKTKKHDLKSMIADAEAFNENKKKKRKNRK